MSGSGKTRERVMLTARLIESLKPEAGPYRIPDMRIPALAIRVAASGEKTWDLAYRISGSSRQRRPSLGRYGDVGLEEARARTLELTAAARQGVDLIANEAESRDAAARAMPMGKLLSSFILIVACAGVFALRARSKAFSSASLLRWRVCQP